jgi:two-component system alkaline phosphatase synthesis response regulator PhoP
MSGETILIIEDDDDIREVVRFHLTRDGYQVFEAADGDKGLQAGQVRLPDVILLDLMLPGRDGLEVCRLLKQDSKTRHIPVIILTAKSEDSDIVTGLELGAEDYITKPFSNKILLARVRAVLRRHKEGAQPADQAVLRIHDLIINPGRREVLLRQKPIDLTFTEFAILHALARRPGWVLTREQIVDAVRGADYAVTDRAVDVQIVGLRRKLGAKADYIDTVRGVGYRFKE